MTSVTLTIDLEDPTGAYAADSRYVAMTQKLLDFCDERQRRATFFPVGRVAEAAPGLVKTIAARGHEIAYHTHNHVPLTKESPEIFRRESRADKERLEQLSGKPVIGFRAPGFSLTRKSLWALDVLSELGFRYSSSIMPTNISRFGLPNAPCTPFLWPNGMIELPLPVASLGPLRMPYVGGIYLYALPFWVVRGLLLRANSKELHWTYAHPYDFDTEEAFKPMPDTPLWMSLVLWLARRRAPTHIRRVLELGEAGTLGERITVSGFAAGLTRYQP